MTKKEIDLIIAAAQRAPLRDMQEAVVLSVVLAKLRKHFAFIHGTEETPQ